MLLLTIERMNSLRGHVLIATPELQDPNFARTVVLLVTHNAEGALGLVLNRPTSVLLQNAWEQLSQSPCAHQTHLYLGGPCQGPLMALHTAKALSDSMVKPGLYFTAKPEELTTLVGSEQGPIRFFVGYAGWGPGQLENELREGSWVTEEAALDYAFEAADRLWDQVTKHRADAKLIADLHIKHVPADPSMN
jgi:putative transcriptional regulator